MKLVRETRRKLGRGFVLLAPPQTHLTLFDHVDDNPERHRRLLADAQKLRGSIYVRDGAIQPWQLSAGGRHIQRADELSWHLLTVDQSDSVTACIRYFAHEPGASFWDLMVSRSPLAQSAYLGPRVREAVQAELDCARQRGFSYVELGGWAICEQLRCTTEALRTLLTVYALSQLLGGALGISAATTRHHSSSILRRVGGRPLMARGGEVPPYYDSQYNCEMELLSFDSMSPNPRYAEWIRECREAILEVPVVAGQTVACQTVACQTMDTSANDLLRLQLALSDPAERPATLPSPPASKELAAVQANQ